MVTAGNGHGLRLFVDDTMFANLLLIDKLLDPNI